MYTMQVILSPLVPLFFGFVVYRLYQAGQFTQSALTKIWSGLAVVFLLLCGNSWMGIMAVESFRRLKPEEVQVLNFYDEARDYARCRPSGTQMPATCLEQSISQPSTIAKLVSTFHATSAYAPNHEGAKDRYLLNIRLKSGKSMWMILGKGNRSTPQTAWIEFNSGIRDGMHYGVYLNEPLYHVLSTQLKLQKWQKK